MDNESVLHGAISGNLPIVWSDQPQTMKTILSETSLPTVVKVWQENRLLANLEGANDIHKPLLVYNEMRGTKVYAKNVTSVDVLAGAPCRDKTPIVVIPVIYNGKLKMRSPQVSIIFHCLLNLFLLRLIIVVLIQC